VPRVAGRYAAWVHDGAIVVYDWQSRSEAYRVRLFAKGVGGAGAFDLQADGKVAFAYADGSPTGKLGWASPEAPQPHPLPLQLARFGQVELRLKRDVVAYLRSPIVAGSARAELGVVSLSGHARTLVRPVEAQDGAELFDFDGERLAWVERSCAGPRVAFASLEALTASPRGGRLPRCRLRLRGRPRLTRSRRSLVVRFDCTGFYSPCFHKRREVRTARGYRLADRRLRRGTRITLPSPFPNTSTGARLQLNKTGRRLLRARRAVRVQVAARVGDEFHTPRRQTHVTLRP